jgi:hypothetical protein
MSDILSLPPESTPVIVRAQTGVRMEKRMVKVLKALAEYHDLSFGELLEGIVLHAFANRTPFSPDTLHRIAQLKEVYGLDYDVDMSHRLREDSAIQEGSPAHRKGA